MDLHRESRRRHEEPLEPAATSPQQEEALRSPDGADPERAYPEKEHQGFLLRAIDELPERLCQTMRCHLACTSYREIADRLAINEANVRKRMQEARALLRQRLADYTAGKATVSGRPPVTAISSPAPESAGRKASPWRVCALRSLVIELPSGAESEAVVQLTYPPRRSSRRRRSALEGYIRKHPNGWKKRHELGRHLIEAGRLEEAVPQLERVVRQQPRQLEPRLELASVHLLRGRSEAAAAAYQKAQGAVPAAAAKALLHGLMARCEGRDEEARRALETAAETAPRCPAARVALAEIHWTRGCPTTTADALDAALAVAGDDVAALTFGHQALRLLGRTSEAGRRTARALELDGRNPLALARWLGARGRATGGRFAPGSTERRRWQRLQQMAAAGVVVCQGSLAFRRACRGDLAGAEKRLAAVVRERPRLVPAWVEYARFLDWLGTAEPAVAALDAAAALHPPDRALQLLACRLATRAGLATRVRRQADILVERYGDAWETVSTAAWALSILGLDPRRARRLSRAAVDLQPHLPAAWFEHGRVLARRDRLPEAVQAFTNGWELLPAGDGFALAVPVALDLAAVHRRLGDHETRRRWARRALARSETLVPADPARGRAWYRQASDLSDSGLAEVRRPGPDPAAAFQRLEARWCLKSQLAEESWGWPSSG